MPGSGRSWPGPLGPRSWPQARPVPCSSMCARCRESSLHEAWGIDRGVSDEGFRPMATLAGLGSRPPKERAGAAAMEAGTGRVPLAHQLRTVRSVSRSRSATSRVSRGRGRRRRSRRFWSAAHTKSSQGVMSMANCGNGGKESGLAASGGAARSEHPSGRSSPESAATSAPRPPRRDRLAQRRQLPPQRHGPRRHHTDPGHRARLTPPSELLRSALRAPLRSSDPLDGSIFKRNKGPISSGLDTVLRSRESASGSESAGPES
jgi:hypothetical protein